MTVSELIEWLKTQDQGANVMVVCGATRDYEEGCDMEYFAPNLSRYRDFRGDPRIHESNYFYNKRTLLLGEIP